MVKLPTIALIEIAGALFHVEMAPVKTQPLFHVLVNTMTLHANSTSISGERDTHNR